MLSDLKVRNPTGFKKLITERTQSSGIWFCVVRWLPVFQKIIHVASVSHLLPLKKKKTCKRFFSDAGDHLPDYISSDPNRSQFWYFQLWEPQI
jgi:hypothetical protein